MTTVPVASEPPLWQETFARLDRLFARYLVRLRQASTSSDASIPDSLVEGGEADRVLAPLGRAHDVEPSGRDARPVRSGPPLPSGLAHAARAYRLDDFEVDVLLLALAPEIELRYARLLGILNEHVDRLRPTVGLTAEVLSLGVGAWSRGLSVFAPDGRLVRFGLVEILGDAPFSAREIRLAPSFWPRLLEDASAPGRATPPAVGNLVTPGPGLDDLVLEPAVRERAGAIVEYLRASGGGDALVRGSDGSGREGLAMALATELGGAALLVTSEALCADSRAVVREARWHDAALVVRGVGGATPAQLSGLPRPVIWIGGNEGHESFLESRPEALEINVGRPDPVTSRAIWERFLPAPARAPLLDLAEVVARFPFSPRRIEVAAARVRGQAPVTTAALVDACRTLPDQRFHGLADRLPSCFAWDDLVIPASTRRELELAMAWAKGGRLALQAHGATRSAAGCGLGCLFYGPPGTGKTMAAQVLGAAVGLDVVRIDLSQVVNKYIGETEKNLARVFDAAREANVILFFDEADALFGRRTEVRDAHDRYANLETGFLLQRIELHEGLTILATNLRANVDGAFFRRLHVLAEFPAPDAGDRRRIWARTLPGLTHRDDDIDLDLLAPRFKLTGGDIRNAIVTAMLLASSEGRRMGMSHVVRGVWRELRKDGRLIGADEFGPWRDEVLRYAQTEARPA